MRDENQLHAAVVELVAHRDAEIKYSTVQIGIQVMKMGKAVFIISLPNEATAKEKIQNQDTNRNGFRDYLEIPKLHLERR